MLMSEIKDLSPSNITFLPYLTGERSPINDPSARGALIGLTLKHTRSDICKAVIDGINLGLLDNLISINALDIKPKCARVVGGGAKSEL
jgi:xylulokinase